MTIKVTLILLLCLPLAGTTGYTQNRSIEFEHGSFDASIAKAKAAGKPLFFDAYTSWCIPCQMMAKQVFTIDSIADYFNTHFINVKFDMEKGEGVALCKKYLITAYPTYFILDTSGKEIYRLMGSRPADEFIAGVKSFSDEQPVLALQKRFDAGERSEGFLIQALTDLFTRNQYTALGSWLAQLDKEDTVGNNVWSFFEAVKNKRDGRAFQFMLGHKTAFLNRLGADRMETYFAECYSPYISHYLSVTRAPDTAYFKELRAGINENILGQERKTVLLAKVAMAEARTEKNVTKMTDAYKAVLTNEGIGDRCFSLQYQTECAREFGTRQQCEETLAYVTAEVKRMNEPNVEKIFVNKLFAPLKERIAALQ